MTYPCPFCGAQAGLAGGCPGCGRGPNQDAALVIRLDGEIAALNVRLRDLWGQRNAAATRVREAVAAAQPAFSQPAAARPAPVFPPVHPAPGPAKETSSKTAQTVLFLLGGLLLAVAAIVFTAVAWSQFGVEGRAVLLAGFTVAALGAPLLALRRNLRATAETFAAVGLLLVLLDGYAAWYVNLFGVAGYSAYGYAGAVCAVTAAVAAGYEHVTGLKGPRYAALLVAQPVLPLMVVPLDPNFTGWAFTLAAVAVLNLVVVHLRPGPLTGVGITAYVCGLFAVMGSGIAAFGGLAVAGSALPALGAGAALVTSSVVVLAGSVLSKVRALPDIAGGLVVLAVAIVGTRVGTLTFPAYAMTTAALTVVAVGAAVLAVPGRFRRGPWFGALATLGLTALALMGDVFTATVRNLGAAYGEEVPSSSWQLPLAVTILTAGIVLLLTIKPGGTWVAFDAAPSGSAPVGSAPLGAAPGPSGAAGPGGGFALLGTARFVVALGGAAFLALVMPAGFGLAWWSGPALNLLVAGVALAVALRTTRVFLVIWAGVVATAMVADAVALGFARSAVAAATLGGVALLGTGVAAAAGERRRGNVGAVSLVGGLLAVPPMAWAVADAIAGDTVWGPRAALFAAAVLAVTAWVIGRGPGGYRVASKVAALTAVVSVPLWPLGSVDSVAVYAAIGLVLVALVGRAGAGPVGVAAMLGAGLLIGTAGSLVSLLLGPYAWLADIWTGTPEGAGFDPSGVGTVVTVDVVALLVVAVAAVVARLSGVTGASGPPATGEVRGALVSAGWAAAAPLALVLPLAVAAAGASWPAVPFVTLAAGLAGLLAVAWRPPSSSGTGRLGAAGAGIVLAVVSVALTGAGLAGALPTHGSTLAALGGTLVAGAVAGTTARHLPARVTGWLAAVASALAFAFTMGRATGMDLPATALLVLAAAAVALAAGTILSGRSPGSGRPVEAGAVPAASGWGRPAEARVVPAASGWGRPVEARAVQAAAHAGAVIALLLALGSARHVAAVLTLWGIALGARALWPALRMGERHILVVTAAGLEVIGWWVLIGSERVSTVELYSLPAAAVALLAGWLARRSAARRGETLNSWLVYGPALAAAALPTLASVLVSDGAPLRRLLLGLGALAVLLAGVRARLQAPVVIGGGVLTVVALHEVTLYWDLLPRWIPIALAGLLLVGLAMTLERRRRDLARVRSALTRMT